MKRLWVFSFGLVFLAGCFGPTVSKSVKTAKLTADSIQQVFITVDGMCSQGALNQLQCDEASKLYGEAKAAYQKVLDAEYLLIDAAIAGKSTEGAEDEVVAAMAVWTPLAIRIVTLAAQYGIVEE